MVPSDHGPCRDGFDAFVSAFDVMWACDGHAEIADVLTPQDDPHGAMGGDSPQDSSRRCVEEVPASGPGCRQSEDASSRPFERQAGDDLRMIHAGSPSIRVDVDRQRPDGLEWAAHSYCELRLRLIGDDSAAVDTWCNNFPGRSEHARMFRDLHLSDPWAAERLAQGLTTLPEVGSDFLGFRLIAELGRGAFGRVYLAQQGDLADRPVALKVTPKLWGESRTLAQLQHTNIVPIYSIHRREPFQAICMPYFGSVTLQDIYDDLGTQGTLPVSGQVLLSRLNHSRSSIRDGSHSSLPVLESGEGSAAVSVPESAVEAIPSQSGLSTDTLEMLEGLTYVQAILWMAARLASGLAHAHERGILHRDLKPANILLTDEGQPMLLDFNLSEDLKNRSDAAAIGGTVYYMAPEHLDALRGGSRPVDARSDLYSFGVVLFELLTGRQPFEIPDVPPDDLLDHLIGSRLGTPLEVRPWNEAITPAVESIVRHCLEPDPGQRYQSARELQEDLERHLAHRPLRHAPEPSLRERMAKWARRHPTACSSSSIALLASILITLTVTAGWFVVEDLKKASARVEHEGFRSFFDECQILLNTNGGPPEHLERGIGLARQALARYGFGATGDWTARSLVRLLPADERRVLREEVSELVLLETRASVALAGRTGSGADRRRALERGVAWLDQVERFDPRPPAALFDDRGRFHAALGHADLAARDRARALHLPPNSARDFYLLGTSLLARGRPDLAELPLSHAVTRDARRFWAWFALGICHADQGRFPDAAFDFGLCTTLAPGFTWSYVNRGLALARSGRLREARFAYDHALELDPNFAEALVDRALTCLELEDAAQALRDLDRAIALGRSTPAVLTARAEALARLDRRVEAERAFVAVIQAAPNSPMPLVARGYSRLPGDRTGAGADFARALELDPRNARALLGQALLLRRDDPRATLAQLERALRADPDFDDAIQLRALVRARLGDPAAEIDVDRLLRVPTPYRLYNAACALSLLSRSAPNPRLVSRALDLLRRALDSGLPPASLADDPDLDPLRHSPLFPRVSNHRDNDEVADEEAILVQGARPPERSGR